MDGWTHIYSSYDLCLVLVRYLSYLVAWYMFITFHQFAHTSKCFEFSSSSCFFWSGFNYGLQCSILSPRFLVVLLQRWQYICNGPRVQTEGVAHIQTHIWHRALMSVKAQQTYPETIHIAMESIMTSYFTVLLL